MPAGVQPSGTGISTHPTSRTLADQLAGGKPVDFAFDQILTKYFSAGLDGWAACV
jgi:hypothetical protein